MLGPEMTEQRADGPRRIRVYRTRIKPAWDRITLEAMFALGDRVTLRHLAIALLVQPELQLALASLDLPSEAQLRTALTGGWMPPETAEATEAATTVRPTLVAHTPGKALYDDQDLDQCVSEASSHDDDDRTRAYCRLIALAVDRDATVRAALADAGLNADAL